MGRIVKYGCYGRNTIYLVLAQYKINYAIFRVQALTLSKWLALASARALIVRESTLIRQWRCTL